MIGLIQRVKNDVLLKCSTLNEKLISDTLNDLINTRIYRYAEELYTSIGSYDNSITENYLREEISNLIKLPISKKIKRKLFIDSLALQVTNDTFIEDYFEKKISLLEINKSYIKELEKNKRSNQLNMTENLDLSEIILKVDEFIENKLIPIVKENTFLSSSIRNSSKEFKNDFETDLKNMIEDANNSYLKIMLDALEEEQEEVKEEEGEDYMIENINEELVLSANEVEDNKQNIFDKYDDITLFNKVLLSLNTAEEKISRKEIKLAEEKEDVDKKLSATNKNIEANIERENKLSERKLKLNNKEVELNAKLSETELIFLNMKPLINGLNKIKEENTNGGSENE